MDNNHFKKMIAPIIIIVIISLYCAGAAAVLLIADMAIAARIVGLLVYSGVFGVSVFVLKERINEIRSGEEDDIGKY